MIYTPQYIVVNDPTNQLPVADTAIDPTGNIFTLMGRQFYASSIRTCNKDCPGGDIANVQRIVIVAPSATMDPLDKVTGFKLSIRRNTDLEVSEFYPIQREQLYDFDFDAVPSPTAAQIAAEFVAQNGATNPSFEADNFATLTIDPLDVTGATLIVTTPAGTFVDIFKLKGSNLTITTINPGATNRLNANEVRRMFPIQPEINGGNNTNWLLPDVSCGTYCVFFVEQCIDACDRNAYDILSEEGVANTIERFYIWIDSANAGYAAWLTALETLAPVCEGVCRKDWVQAGASFAENANTNYGLKITKNAVATYYPFLNTGAVFADAETPALVSEVQGEIVRIVTALGLDPIDTVVAVADAGAGVFSIGITGVPVAFTAIELRHTSNTVSASIFTAGAQYGDC